MVCLSKSVIGFVFQLVDGDVERNRMDSYPSSITSSSASDRSTSPFHCCNSGVDPQQLAQVAPYFDQNQDGVLSNKCDVCISQSAKLCAICDGGDRRLALNRYWLS